MSNNSDMQALMNRYGIVGRNEALREALATAVLVAPTDLSVLIQGESGVGKEVIPRIIHDHSKRRGKTYIAINCGSIPEGTIDSELFGHEKGAFTSAIGEHEGYFGAADGGTLFLDEVGELPLSTQARLLRVLETGEYIRVGSSTPRKTNVRIVAATNVDIPNAIKQGRFREDLYYRLCTINIKIPPLRKRHGDAVLLFMKFALDTAERYNIPEPIRLTPEAEAVVNSYKWPGNIRQLRNITEQLSILSESRSITPEVLAKYGITPNSDTDTGIATIAGSNGSGGQHDYEQEIKILAHAVFELRWNDFCSALDLLGEYDASGIQRAVSTLYDVEQGFIRHYVPVDGQGKEVDFHGWRGAGTLSQARSFSSWHATASPQPV